MWIGKFALQWRHNDSDGVSNHQTHDYLLNLLSRRRSKLRVTGPLGGEFTGDRWIIAQRASNVENSSIWWRLHGAQNIWMQEWSLVSKNQKYLIDLLKSQPIRNVDLTVTHWGPGEPYGLELLALLQDIGCWPLDTKPSHEPMLLPLDPIELSSRVFKQSLIQMRKSVWKINRLNVLDITQCSMCWCILSKVCMSNVSSHICMSFSTYRYRWTCAHIRKWLCTYFRIYVHV